MTLTGTILAILVGACWLAAATHFFAGIRRSFSPPHLTFALFAFATGTQSLAFVWLHHTTDVSQYIEALRWGSSAGCVSGATLLWFARFYTRSDDVVVPSLLSLLYGVRLVLNLYLPYGFFFEHPPTLTQFMLPWGEQATIHVFDGLSWRSIATLSLNFSTFAYVFYACVRQYRRGQRHAASTLAISTLVVLIAILGNVVITASGFRSLYLSNFAFLAFVVAMMYWLSSDESFRTLVAQASEGIFIADRRGRYIDVNAAGSELLGWTREELCSMHVYDIIAPADLPNVAAQEAVLLSGATVRGSWNFKRKDGSVFAGELSSRLLPDGRILGMLRDVTEQLRLLRSLEERVAVRTAEYAELNRQLESFAYSVSHDLRAPVRAIGALSTVLLQDHAAHLDAEARSHLDRIVSATRHMNELIEGLLQLAKMSHQTLRNEAVDLEQLVRDIIKMMREREPGRQIDITCDALPCIRGDQRLLAIALRNLLENAWKYTGRRPRARIEIGCLHEDDRTVFYVRDNGAGFDMQYAEHLFEPFRRLHSPQEFSGTGIGLATVARVVERHGGQIWAQAALDAGATFFFTLAPRVPQDMPESRPPSRPVQTAVS